MQDETGRLEVVLISLTSTARSAASGSQRLSGGSSKPHAHLRKVNAVDGPCSWRLELNDRPSE